MSPFLRKTFQGVNPKHRTQEAKKLSFFSCKGIELTSNPQPRVELTSQMKRRKFKNCAILDQPCQKFLFDTSPDLFVFVLDTLEVGCRLNDPRRAGWRGQIDELLKENCCLRHYHAVITTKRWRNTWSVVEVWQSASWRFDITSTICFQRFLKNKSTVFELMLTRQCGCGKF